MGRGMALSVLMVRIGVGLSTVLNRRTWQPDRTVKRLYDGPCPSGTVGKRDLTHGAGAQGAHGVIRRGGPVRMVRHAHRLSRSVSTTVTFG
ncbi:hypothetical protein GCM10010388_59040 [Streptomyces mauvecolor]